MLAGVVALEGILEAILAQMESLGAIPSQIVATIGPGIQQAAYEVNQPFYLQFCENKSSNAVFFKPTGPGHWTFDLPGYIHQRLDQLGLQEINNLGLDTYTRSDLYSADGHSMRG
jgi:copper oxidase (laccase) domain-containing protein